MVLNLLDHVVFGQYSQKLVVVIDDGKGANVLLTHDFDGVVDRFFGQGGQYRRTHERRQRRIARGVVQTEADHVALRDDADRLAMVDNDDGRGLELVHHGNGVVQRGVLRDA